MRKGLFASVLALCLLGTAPAAHAALTWNTTSFDYGNQEVGNASAAVTFTLTATCDAEAAAGLCLTPAHPFGSVTAPGDEFGVETTDCTGPALLTPNFPQSVSCTARVTFKPTTEGLKTGVLDTAGPDVALSGTGVLEGKKNNGSGGGKKCSKKKKGKKNNSATAAKKKKGCKKGKKGK